MALLGWKKQWTRALKKNKKESCKTVGNVTKFLSSLQFAPISSFQNETTHVLQCVHINPLVLAPQTHAFGFAEAMPPLEAYHVMSDLPQCNWSRRASHFRTTTQHCRLSSFIQKEPGQELPQAATWPPLLFRTWSNKHPHPALSQAEVLENVTPCTLSVYWQQ
jgi:hypothetical protein